MVPIGGIIAWADIPSTVPSNYQIADGSNGTPDLRTRVLIGAGGAFNVGDSGGALTHSHAPGATHDCPGSGGISAWSAGNSAQESSMPPYFSPYWIIRMS